MLRAQTYWEIFSKNLRNFALLEILPGAEKGDGNTVSRTAGHSLKEEEEEEKEDYTKVPCRLDPEGTNIYVYIEMFQSFMLN